MVQRSLKSDASLSYGSISFLCRGALFLQASIALFYDVFNTFCLAYLLIPLCHFP